MKFIEYFAALLIMVLSIVFLSMITSINNLILASGYATADVYGASLIVGFLTLTLAYVISFWR